MSDNNPSRDAIDFTEAVFHRPGMYTINGTLEEAGAFLEGYYSAIARFSPQEWADRESRRWWDFCAWLGPRVGVAEGGSWHSVFKALRARYSEDEAGFALLREKYPEFIAGAK